MITYFISDLHLHVNQPRLTQLFLDFLQEKAPHADALYILGDFFALWLGDDVEIPQFPEVCAAMRQLVSQGVPIYIMRGNRDFLLGNHFAKATNSTLLPDPYVIDLYEKRILLTHGDRLCTLDTGYQKFRTFVQNPLIKWIFLNIPARLRTKIGLWVKSKANRQKANIDYNQPKYDVTSTAVTKWRKKYKAPLIVHGHTHRPQITPAHIVLGEWTPKGALILQISSEEEKLIDLCSP